MNILLHDRRFARLFVGLCYLVVSLILPLQHHHGIVDDIVASAVNSRSARHASVSYPSHTQIAAKKLATAPAHCAACEWQAANVSPALPIHAFSFALPVATRFLLAAHRSPSRRTHFSASRAPPIA